MSIGVNSVIIIALLAAAVVVGARFVMSAPPGAPLDFATLTRPDSPNTYLLAPDSASQAEPDGTAPWFDMPPADLAEAWKAVAEEQPKTVKVWESEDGLQVSYVQRTPLMSYPDTITAQVITNSDNQSSLMVYSRSHYGYSDMGQNKKRIDAWIAALRQKAAAGQPDS